MIKQSKIMIAGILMAIMFAWSENVSLKGMVVDKDSKPLSGVKVALQSAGLSAVTDENGMFEITGKLTATKLNLANQKNGSPYIKGNLLWLGLNAEHNVSIDILDISGRMIDRYFNGSLSAGSEYLSLPVSGLLRGVYLVRVQTSGQTYVCKYVNTGSAYSGGLPSGRENNSFLAKRAAVTDTLVLSKSGWNTKKLPVSDYSDSLEVVTLSENQSASAFTDERDTRIYQTVKIGDDIWMAENLKYKPSTGNSWCYDDDKENCETYGRLYDYKTATKTSHGNRRDVCPVEWRLPTKEEWETLISQGGGTAVAGKALKSASDWGDGSTDALGLNLVPGGLRTAAGSYLGINDRAYLWMNKGEGNESGYTVLKDKDEISAFSENYATFGFNVRCVWDTSVTVNNNETDSTFTDSRDGQVYKKTVIGEQTWMAENLNYDASGGKSLCYNSQEASCEKYGRLYDYPTVIADNHGNDQDICPEGWHMPIRAEWMELMSFVGGENTAAWALEAVGEWGGSATTDKYGFAMLPSGFTKADGVFYQLGNQGILWIDNEGNNVMMSPTFNIGGNNLILWQYVASDVAGWSFAVRCLKDE
ncbi:MAG: T9SS type A sorting domain-containing protein [Fibrobacteria bacterium]|nr:T9SS type A sorting domain-containing protein [Fibrobacteria bacterium]